MGRHRQAVATWTRLCEEHPDMVHEVARLVQTSAEGLGKPVLYVDFLNRALATSADERLQLLLVDYLSSQGRTQEAETHLLSWVDENASLPGLHRLLEIRTGEDSTTVSTQDYRLVQRVTGKLLADRTGYERRFCGFQGKSLHWQCPGCKHWDTTMPRLATTKWS